MLGEGASGSCSLCRVRDPCQPAASPDPGHRRGAGGLRPSPGACCPVWSCLGSGVPAVGYEARAQEGGTHSAQGSMDSNMQTRHRGAC